MQKPTPTKSLQHRLAVALVIVVGVGASVAAYQQQRRSIVESAHEALAAVADERSDHLRQGLDRSVSSLHALAGLFLVRGEVSRSDFQKYVAHSLHLFPEVAKFQWQPKVADRDRAAYVQRARAEGLTEFEFMEPAPAGQLREAPSRPVHFPIYYEASHRHYASSLGLDLAWDPQRLASKLEARDIGLAVASRVYELASVARISPPGPHRLGLNISVPVYGVAEPATLAERREQLRGFVAAVISLPELFAPVVRGLAEDGIDLVVNDVTEEKPQQVLARLSPQSDFAARTVSARSPLDLAIPVEFAQRKWLMVFHPTPAFVAAHDRGQAPVILGSGLLLTLVLAALLHGSLRRRQELERINGQLRDNEEHFRFLVEGTSVIAWELDMATFRFTYVSPVAETMLGYPLAEWYEEGFWIEHLHPDDRSYAVNYCTTFTGQGLDHRFEYRMLKADGGIIWIEDVVSVLKDADGRVQVRGIMIDVTGRKQTEKALRDSEERLRAVVSNVPLLMFALDRQGKFTLTDGKELATLGSRPGQAVGADVFRLYGGNREIIEGVAEALSGQAHQNRVRLKGQLYDTWFSPIMDDSGKVTGVIGCALNITSREHAQQRLAEALELNRQIVSTSPLGISAYKASGECVLANEAAARLVGTSADQFLGRDFNSLESWRQSGLLAAAQEVLASGTRRHREFFLKYFGRDTWLDCDLAAFTAGGEPHLLLMANDVTERKLSEQLLQETEAKFRSLVEESVVGVCIIQDGCFAYVNPKLAAIFGYGQEEMTASVTVADTVSEQSRSVVLDNIGKRLEGELQSVQYEVVGRRKDGSLVQLLACGTRTVFRGRPAIIGTLLDVSEQKRAQDALQEQLHFIRQLLDAIPSPVFYKDAQGRYVGCNAAFEGAMGVDHQQIIGKTEADISPRDLADISEAADRELLDRLGTQTYEAEVQFADGSRHNVLFYKATFFRTDGRLGGLVGVMLDITDRKRAEQERLSLEAKLRQAQKMESIGHLSGGIAHDFNNILTAVVGYAELAQMSLTGAEDARFATFLGEILLAASRARDLVAQLLAFSRAEEAAADVVNVEPIVAEVVKLLRSTVPTTLSIAVDVAPRLPHARISPVQLHQVLMNLVINARDAMSAHGRIDIRVRAERVPELINCASCHRDFRGNYLLLSVKDEGEGISAEVMEKIFDPFFTTKEVGKGSGLGLSVLHGIVHSAGGHVRVVSEPGRGAEFLIYLPAAQCPRSTAKGEAYEPAHLPRLSGHIAVVDDEGPIVAFMSELLQSMGCRVTGFTDPLAALQRFRDEPEAFDLLITDQTMPGLTGIELNGKVQALRPGLPTVLCTGFSMTVGVDNASSLGVSRFLLKPVSATLLAATVTDLLTPRLALSGEGEMQTSVE